MKLGIIPAPNIKQIKESKTNFFLKKLQIITNRILAIKRTGNANPKNEKNQYTLGSMYEDR